MENEICALRPTGNDGKFVAVRQTWKWSFGGDWTISWFQSGKPPNRFHRFMMRVFLGIHSETLPQ